MILQKKYLVIGCCWTSENIDTTLNLNFEIFLIRNLLQFFFDLRNVLIMKSMWEGHCYKENHDKRTFGLSYISEVTTEQPLLLLFGSYLYNFKIIQFKFVRSCKIYLFINNSYIVKNIKGHFLLHICFWW